jgi:hypothetical protein
VREREGERGGVLLVGFFALGALSGGHGLILELGAIVLQLLVEHNALLLQVLIVGVDRFQFLYILIKRERERTLQNW